MASSCLGLTSERSMSLWRDDTPQREQLQCDVVSPLPEQAYQDAGLSLVASRARVLHFHSLPWG